MDFSTPLWLAALLPWAAVSAWLLAGRWERAAVPFLPLWTVRTAAVPRKARALRRPPAWIALLILAMALAITAAAGPRWKRRGVPPAAANDVSIADFAARAVPTSQVMVRLRNESDAAAATLRIISDSQAIQRQVDLPPHGQERNYFLNTPPLGQTVQAELRPIVKSPVGPYPQLATLMRNAPWPRLAVGGSTPLPTAVQRMMAVYTRRRPPAAGAALAVVSLDPLPPEASGVQLVPPREGTGSPGESPAVVVPHALVTHILQWPRAANPAATPPAGTTPLVRRGQSVLLAATDAPNRRQVWANLDLAAWNQSPDWVIFFANACDWLGEADGPSRGTAQYHPEPPPAASPPKSPAENPAPAGEFNRSISLSPWLCLAALTASITAMSLWPEKPLQK